MRRKYMNKQFKKILSVTLALIVGFGIIFFAWKSTAPAGNKVSFEPAISGDSWKGSLLAVPQTSSIKNLEQNVAGAARQLRSCTAKHVNHNIERRRSAGACANAR